MAAEAGLVPRSRGLDSPVLIWWVSRVYFLALLACATGDTPYREADQINIQSHERELQAALRCHPIVGGSVLKFPPVPQRQAPGRRVSYRR